MSIPRRTSSSALESTSQESGVYCSALGKRIDELDEAFEDEFPDLPSLTPGPRDIAMTKAALPREMLPKEMLPREMLPRERFPREVAPPTAEVPDLVFDRAPARPPMVRTTSSANIAAVRAPDLHLPAPPAPEIRFESSPPVPMALDFPVRAPSPRVVVESRERSIFDSFDDDNVDISLDIKVAPKNQVTLQTMSGAELSPASERSRESPISQVSPISSTQKGDDPRPGIVAFAGFGLPPESLGAMPAYAVRVLARKWTLRDDLRVARLRRIKDVSLYEAALACADESAVTKGLALIAATLIGGVSAVVAAAAFLL